MWPSGMRIPALHDAHAADPSYRRSVRWTAQTSAHPPIACSGRRQAELRRLMAAHIDSARERQVRWRPSHPGRAGP